MATPWSPAGPVVSAPEANRAEPVAALPVAPAVIPRDEFSLEQHVGRLAGRHAFAAASMASGRLLGLPPNGRRRSAEHEAQRRDLLLYR